MKHETIKFRICADDIDYVKIKDKTYFLFEINDIAYLLPTTCPHRGGPLHFGKLFNKGEKWYVQCPWHEKQINVEYLIENGIKLTRDGDYLCLELSASEYKEEEVILSKRYILINNEVNSIINL